MSSKIECTAVNELIDLVYQKPMDRDSSAELLFAPPAPSDPGARHAANAEKAARPRPFPVEVASEPTPVRALAALDPITAVTGRNPRPLIHDDLETTYIPRQAGTDLPRLLRRLAVPASLLVLVGISVGATISIIRHHEEGKRFDYIAATTLPKLVPAVTPKLPAPTVPVTATLVAVRFESTPAGASATLLDRETGNSMPLGSTPLEASLDPAKSYDVRFELDGRPSTTEHLALAANQTSPRLAVTFAEPEPTPAPVLTAKPHHHRHQAARAGHAGVTKAATKAVKRASAPRTPGTTTPPASSSGEAALASLGPAHAKQVVAPGALAVSASVPCAILLDGINTGRTTPAKLTLPAGHHSVRLIAATQHINKQFGVDVTSKATTRLDQTF